ncbi:MAG: glycerophosphodiester phosphodiesterase, partial [Pseudomonadota bacterium]|nr:glycerophosphodiester phosphodiesterase [Pseudomonadota bacterium]
RHRLWMNVEIKPSTGAEARTGAVVAATTLAALQSEQATPLLSSFSFDALVAARAAAPDLPRGWLVERVPADWQDRLEALDAVALHVNQRHLRASEARAVKNAGYGLFCYTVNSIERAQELFGFGVDAFCTDRIDLIGADFSPDDA